LWWDFVLNTVFVVCVVDQLAEDLARGLAYLHEHKIVHQDIKSLNIVLDEDFHGKLSDFGLTQLNSNLIKAATEGGTAVGAHWMSPELFTHKRSMSSMASDIWALGMVFFELF